MTLAYIRSFSSFTYLNIAQFLGALNDNVYKMLIVFFLIGLEGAENSHTILGSVGALIVLPFLLFSPIAGTLADRYSKRNIIVIAKFFELGVMILGVVGFALESKGLSYATLFLLACHSTLFSPSKYGIVPELIKPDFISKANGLLTSFTYLAIIVGTFFASFITQITHRNYVMAASCCAVFSVIGILASLCIVHTPPSGSSKKVSARILTTTYRALKLAKQIPSLLPAIFGAAFFLFIGAYVQMNIIPFSIESLGLSDIEGGYLFLLTALGIGLGSLLAGKASGGGIELGMVPFAALGIAICSALLSVFDFSLLTVVPLVILLGFFAGFYEVPLDAYIQMASPVQDRGQCLAASSFLSFVGVLCASFSIYFFSSVLHLEASSGFAVIGILTLLITAIYAYLFFAHITHLIAKVMARLHFCTSLYGENHIPQSAALYICTHTAWNDTLLLLGAQKKQMRFFIEKEQAHSKWMKRLYGLLHIESTPLDQPLYQSLKKVKKPTSEKKGDAAHNLQEIKNTLNKGISVCLFITESNMEKEIAKEGYVEAFKAILEETPYPIIPVYIDKGKKDLAIPFLPHLCLKYRVPAVVSFGKIAPKKGAKMEAKTGK